MAGAIPGSTIAERSPSGTKRITLCGDPVWARAPETAAKAQNRAAAIPTEARILLLLSSGPNHRRAPLPSRKPAKRGEDRLTWRGYHAVCDSFVTESPRGLSRFWFAAGSPRGQRHSEKSLPDAPARLDRAADTAGNFRYASGSAAMRDRDFDDPQPDAYRAHLHF